MQFVSLIASTLLIVLISQHSITAFPIDELTTEHPCSEGFELFNGSCVKINSKLRHDEVESSSTLLETVTLFDAKVILQSDEPRRVGACPKGLVRAENGICKEIISQDQPAITVEPKEGNEEPLEVTGEPLEVTEEPLDVTDESLDVTGEPFEATEEPFDVTGEPFEATEEPLDVTGEPLDVTGEPLEVTEEPLDVTGEPLKFTTERSTFDDKSADGIAHESGKVEIPKGCPPGTKADEDGACQDIRPTTTKKTLTDLKVLLNKDGSCPDDMTKINGVCMYMRSKTMSKINQNFATLNDEDIAASRLPVSNNKDGEYQPSAVLADNSCPKGTEYSEYGVCRKRIRPSNFDTLDVTKSECPEDQVFVDGQCILKKVEVLLPKNVITEAVKTTTFAPKTEQSEDDESPRRTTKTTVVDKPNLDA